MGIHLHASAYTMLLLIAGLEFWWTWRFTGACDHIAPTCEDVCIPCLNVLSCSSWQHKLNWFAHTHHCGVTCVGCYTHMLPKPTLSPNRCLFSTEKKQFQRWENGIVFYFGQFSSFKIQHLKFEHNLSTKNLFIRPHKYNKTSMT